MNIKELNQKIQKDEVEVQSLRRKVADLKNKIDKLNDELAAAERDKAKLESLQNPEDVKNAQPKIAKLKTKIEELKTDISKKDIQLNEYNDQLQKILKSLEENKKQLAKEQEKIQKKKEEAKNKIYFEEHSSKPFSVNEGDYVFHWCYGPMQVNQIDKYIHCTIVDPDGIANVASGKFRTGEVKKFPLDAPGKWLFKDSTDIMNSAFFAPTLQHESFAG